MVEMIGKARKIRRVNPGANGDMVLYHLDPPLENDFGLDWTVSIDYVVLSTVDNIYACETLAFPADSKGEIIDWGEVGGFRNCLSKDVVLADMGYEVV